MQSPEILTTKDSSLVVFPEPTKVETENNSRTSPPLAKLSATA
jgi:hypothetical protein